jgi:hypothetical protein
MQYVARQPEAVGGSWQKSQLLAITGARFAVNCASVLGGGQRRLGHQASEAPSAEELAEWYRLWNLLSTWYGRPSNETFMPASLVAEAGNKRSRA